MLNPFEQTAVKMKKAVIDIHAIAKYHDKPSNGEEVYARMLYDLKKLLEQTGWKDYRITKVIEKSIEAPNRTYLVDAEVPDKPNMLHVEIMGIKNGVIGRQTLMLRAQLSTPLPEVEEYSDEEKMLRELRELDDKAAFDDWYHKHLMNPTYLTDHLQPST